MAGIHGKNAELRIATSATNVSGTFLTALSAPNDDIYQAPSGSRDWKWDRNNILIAFDETPGGTVHEVNVQTRWINYAGGAIWLGGYPNASGVHVVKADSMTLTTVASLIGDARTFTVTVTADTIDTTTIGESWATSEEGFTKFEGSLDGLYINDFWYKQAISTISGIIPRKVLKFVPNPADTDTYYQGTVIFPSWEITGGFDSVIEHTVNFEGRGPLDLISDGVPYFNINP